MDTKTAISTRTRSSPRAETPARSNGSGLDNSFAERFASVWARPTPEALAGLLQPDVVLYQPHRPPIRGRAAALAEFRKLLDWMPLFHGEDFQASGGEDVVFIEWVMTVPLPRRAVRIPAVDRFLLRDGLAQERTVYFDQMRLLTDVITRPGLWPGFIKYRWG